MRRLILLCSATLAVAAAATPAGAEGPYVGVQGGAYFERPLSYDFVGLDNFFSSKYRTGYDVSGRLGYDFEGIRIDAELGYKRAAADQFGFMISGQPLAVQHGAGVTGNINTVSAMANIYWDITQKRIRPYIGGGAGVARVSSDKVGYAGVGSDGIFLDKSDVAFAYQLMAGVNARITPHLSANVGYRYFGVENYHLAVFNTRASSSLHSSSVLGGLTYSFGRSVFDLPPPPVPPAVTQAPEASVIADAPAPAPLPTSFTVTFAPGNAMLSATSKATLDQAALGFGQAGHADVMILGSASQAGPAVYNEALAARRVAALRAYLVGKAIPARAVVVQSADIPKLDPSSPANAGAPAPTLYISFGPGSGQ